MVMVTPMRKSTVMVTSIIINSLIRLITTTSIWLITDLEMDMLMEKGMETMDQEPTTEVITELPMDMD